MNALQIIADVAGGLMLSIGCAALERRTKRMPDAAVSCPVTCDCCPKGTDFLKVQMQPRSDRKIDLVMDANMDVMAVRRLHGIDTVVLNTIERMALDAKTLGLTTKAAALRSLAAQLDAEWANELTAHAAACS